MLKMELLMDLPDWPEIAGDFWEWVSFMEQNVHFNRPNSKIHTVEHCNRVLFYALLIAHRKGLEAEDRRALALAAVYHDCRRDNDAYDVGHGQRAADLYKEKCLRNGETMDERTYYVMAYHDRPDEEGIKALEAANLPNGILLFQIFKDSDGLDRVRLGDGPAGLDPAQLRTDEAKALVPFAKQFSAA